MIYRCILRGFSKVPDVRCREIKHVGLISYEIYISENRTFCNIILIAKMRYSRTGLIMIRSKKDAICMPGNWAKHYKYVNA
jgi:hypothetical protein